MAAFIAHGEKSDGAYVPSFAFDGPLLTDSHARVHGETADVEGWLAPEDSLKLYELGYLAPGPFLEIGTYRGKSATVIATALRDAGRHVPFYSLDIAGESLAAARETLAARRLGRHVTLVHASVNGFFRAFPDFEPRFVFLDGDHSAGGLGRDLAAIESRVPEGGLLLFHDYVNARNDDPRDRAYGVPQAVERSWVARDCEFAGTFGCTALYRRVRGPRPRRGSADTPVLVELIGLDRLAVRLLIQVARPVKRFSRRTIKRIRS